MNVRKILSLAIVSLGLAVSLSLAQRLIYMPVSTFEGHTGSVSSVVSSPDGKTLASVSNDDQTIRVWDIATKKERTTLRGHTGDVRSVAFSPAGNTLASAGGKDKTIKVWDVATGEERATFQGHTGDVCSVAFSPDGNTLASGSGDNTVRLWNVVTGEERAILRGCKDDVRAVAFSPDGKTLASGGGVDTVKLWDVTSGEERVTLKAEMLSSVCQVAFSPDGKTLVSQYYLGPRIKLWDVATGKERYFEEPDWLVHLSGHQVESIAFSPDGTTLAICTDMDEDESGIGLWDVASGKNTATFGRGHRPLFSPIIDAINSLGVFTEPKVHSVVFNSDGNLVAFGSNYKTVKMWQVAVLPNGKEK